MLNRLYGSIVWASEGLAVPVPVPVLVPVEVEVEEAKLEVAAAVAGRDESFASVYSHGFMVSLFCLDLSRNLRHSSMSEDSHSNFQGSEHVF